MDDKATRTHFYHADASAIGGRIERPFEQVVPVQAPLSLPAVGGYATARSEDFRFQGILSFQAAQTQVREALTNVTAVGQRSYQPRSKV